MNHVRPLKSNECIKGIRRAVLMIDLIYHQSDALREKNSRITAMNITELKVLTLMKLSLCDF